MNVTQYACFVNNIGDPGKSGENRGDPGKFRENFGEIPVKFWGNSGEIRGDPEIRRDPILKLLCMAMGVVYRGKP